MNDKSVYERLDEIYNEQIKMKKILTNEHKTLNDKEILTNFILHSSKKYVYNESKYKFSKTKITISIVYLLFLAIGIINSIVSYKVNNMYTTFIFLENIYQFIMLFTLIFIILCKKEYDYFKFILNAPIKFKNYILYINDFKIKTFHKIMFLIACISSLLSLLNHFIFKETYNYLFIILECLFLIFTILIYNLVKIFLFNYSYIQLKGIKLESKEDITIIYDCKEKRFNSINVLD